MVKSLSQTGGADLSPRLIGPEIIDSEIKGVRGGFDRTDQRSFQLENVGLPPLVRKPRHQEIKAWPK